MAEGDLPIRGPLVLPARPGRTGEPPVQLASGQHQRSPDREVTLGHAAGHPSMRVVTMRVLGIGAAAEHGADPQVT